MCELSGALQHNYYAPKITVFMPLNSPPKFLLACAYRFCPILISMRIQVAFLYMKLQKINYLAAKPL